MNSNPLVSIIVPVYNVRHYLPACIESLVNQSYKNIELLFIDDGSTDNSIEIIQQYQKNDSRIIIHSQANGGPGPARNLGLDRSSGDYFIFVDGDDWLDTTCIEIVVKNAFATQADIVCFGFRKVKKTPNIEIIHQLSYSPKEIQQVDRIKNFLAENSKEKDHLNTAAWGKLYKKELIEKNNIRFRLSIYEDSPFVLETVYFANKILCISDVFYNYFIRETDNQNKSVTSNTVSIEKLNSFYAADLLMKNFLLNKGIFKANKSDFYRFHNIRILLYGGYFEIYVTTNLTDKKIANDFISLLIANKEDITFDRSNVYRVYRKRIIVLKFGLILSKISISLTNSFFKFYEKTLAPK